MIEISKGRLVALALAALYVVAAWLAELEPMGHFRYVMATIVAEALIWFPDQLGSATGMRTAYGLKSVDAETPGCVVAVFGWLMLLAVPLVYWGLQ